MGVSKTDKIYVAGHNGMVGSAVWRSLEANGYTNLIGKSSSDLDLKDQVATNQFFDVEKPKVVIDSAARVGGILANNNYPYQFIMENMQIQNNLIDAAHRNDVIKFIFLGSSCIYPKLAPQPIKEEYLLSDKLEPTNEWYAIAKISGVKTCEAIKKQYGKDFISLMPTNLYGPHDNFDLETSHVLPAMIRKFHEAKINDHKPVVLWGTGEPRRELLFVDDLASAVLFCVQNDLSESLYNVGTGIDISIKDLAMLVQRIVGHKGDILWDDSKPDGTPRKLLDVSKLKAAGWYNETKLNEGIKLSYNWFVNNQSSFKKVSF